MKAFRAAILRNVALMSASVAMCFAMLEIGLRLYYGNPPPFRYPQVRLQPEPYGFKLVPNQSGSFTLDKPVRSNADGFRDDPWPGAAPKTGPRVMIIGDSFTFGNNAREEDTFAALVEQQLRAVFDGASVLNAGMGGWNVDNYAEFFVREGVRQSPDIVVVAFFNNDFQSPGSPIFIPPLSDDLRFDSRPKWLRWVPYRVLFLIKRSAVVVFLRDRLAVIGQETNSWNMRLLTNQLDLDSDPIIANTYRELGRIADAVNMYGGRLMIVVLPSVNTFWMPRDTANWVAHMGRFAESRQATFLDAAEGFWAAGNTDRFFGYPWDNHFLPAGHALVADQMASRLIGMLRDTAASARRPPR